MVGPGHIVRVFAQQLAPPNVGIDRAADDRARSNDGHLDGQVVEITRLGARQHLDLRTALDLEQTDGVALADGVVDRRVVIGDRAHVEFFAATLPDQLQALLDQ